MANTNLTPNAGDLNLSMKNPRLTPLAAAIAAVGVLVSIVANNPTALTPGRGLLLATGQAASRGTTGIITPATGALVLGNEPAAASGSLTTGTGALTASGVAAELLQGVVKAPGVGSLLFSIGPVITPNTGALTATGGVPSFFEGFPTKTPGVGSLTLAGLPPYLPGFSGQKTPWTGALVLGEPALQVLNTSLTPGAGRLLLGFPTLGITPNTGAASFTGQAPSLLTNTIRPPLSGALVLTGNAPGPFGTNLTPATGALTVTGELVAPSRSLVVGTGALLLVGDFPRVGGFVQAAPASAALALQGFAPTIDVTGHVTLRPAAGALTAAGIAPSLLADRRIEPSPGALILAGQTSPIPGQSMVTATGAASFASDPPELRYAVFIRPPSGLLVAAGRVPNVGGVPPRGGVRFRPKSGRVVFAVPDREESLT